MDHARLDALLKRFHELEHELTEEIEKRLDETREQFRYQLEQGRVRFERGMVSTHLKKRTGLWYYLRTAQIGHLLTAPLIYLQLLPFSLLDLFVTLYQWVCFPVYRIPRVRRSDYIVIDRHRLAYLNLVEKLNCVYCGYANGVIEYVREIAGRTEQYWCPIKHARRALGAHRFAAEFSDFGDAEAYQQRLRKLREALRELE